MSVRFFQSTDSGAPVLTGEAGSLAALLKACLVDGYGEMTPPGGWEALTGPSGQKAAFRSTDAGATGIWLHLDDSAPATPQFANVRCYETLTELDVNGDPSGWAGQFPSAGSQSVCGIRKSNTSDTTPRPWSVAADSRFVYLFIEWNHATYSGGQVKTGCSFFGDLVTHRQGDAYHYLVRMDSANSGSDPGASGFNSGATLNSSPFTVLDPNHWLARRFDQTGGFVGATKVGEFTSGNGGVGTGGYAYPNPADNSLVIAPLVVNEQGGVLRGILPGVYQPLHARPLSHLSELASPTGLPGRTLKAVGVSVSTSTSPVALGEYLVDVTGPWR